MKYGSIQNIETVYYIRVFLKDENGNEVFCFLGTDAMDSSIEGGSLGQLKLYMLDGDFDNDETREEKKVQFFSSAVFFKDKNVALEILNRYIKNISIGSHSNPPVVENIERYKGIPLQMMERIGISNGFIRETVQVSDRVVEYRLTIK